jgi:hypothetical protein
MGEEPKREWKVIDLKREMLRRGWAPTPKAVEASVKKLRELEQIEPVKYGYYRLAAPIVRGAAAEIQERQGATDVPPNLT